MRLLFVLRHSGYVRNFEWAIRELSARGHAVELAFEIARDEAEVAERLGSLPGVTVGHAPVRRDWAHALASVIRPIVDYLRYLAPEYREADFLRDRATRGVPRLVVRFVGPPGRNPGRARLLARLLSGWARAIPPSTHLVSALRDRRADALVVTPLVSEINQHELVRAARVAGLPVALAVHSWDNLTNKGLIQEPPDRTYVWNDVQRREAIDLHGLPEADVVAVGGHSYDHWFTWRPTDERDTFCRKVGLDSSEPYLLYVCSSAQIAPNEVEFVRRWLDELRADERLSRVGVLVRPHPYNGAIWEGSPLADYERVAVWPPQGSEPRDPARRAEYFDSIHHARAVVGLNTTALIEAAIVGRRTYTVAGAGDRDTQGGTLHFHYLVSENGGPLVVAEGFEQHRADLGDALTEAPADWAGAFVESFIRPHGRHVAGAPLLVDDLERFVSGARPEPAPPTSRLLAALSRPVGLLVELLVYERPGATPPVSAAGERRPRRPLRTRLRKGARQRRGRVVRRVRGVGRRLAQVRGRSNRA